MQEGHALHFRPYSPADRPSCLALFDTNCPTFFAPNERSDYEAFLAGNPATYQVGLCGDEIVGAYGLMIDAARRRGRLSWIMVDAAAHGRGLGAGMMRRVLETVRSRGVSVVDIAASQKSAPFFARFGAVERSRAVEGWGSGLDRVDMELEL